MTASRRRRGSPRRASSGWPRCWARVRRVTVGERERRADLGDGGGAFCAFVDGECVVDVWTGPAGPDGRAWEEDTRAVIMSSTKGMTTLCAHLLEDRGELDLDAPVVRYWPEFGSRPASRRPRCASCSATSRAPSGCPGPTSCCRGTGAGGTTRSPSPPASPAASRPGSRGPGTATTASRSAGWSASWCDGSAGQSLGTFFEAEVAGPLGVPALSPSGRPPARSDRWPPSWSSRCKPGKESALRAIDPESKSGRSVLAGAHGSLFADEEGRPRFADFMNTPAVLQAEIGALGATATARALARTYAALADRRGAGVARLGGALPHRAGLRARRRHGRAHPVGRRLLARAAGARPRRPADARARTTARSGTWAPAARSGSPTRRPASAAASCATTWRTRRCPLMGACLVDVLYSCTGERSDKGGAVYAAEHAAEHPDQPAIVMAPSGRTLTFAEYEAGGQPGRPRPARDRPAHAATTWRSSWRTTPPCCSPRRAPSAPGSTSRRSTPTSRPRRWPTSSTTPSPGSS